MGNPIFCSVLRWVVNVCTFFRQGKSVKENPIFLCACSLCSLMEVEVTSLQRTVYSINFFCFMFSLTWFGSWIGLNKLGKLVCVKSSHATKNLQQQGFQDLFAKYSNSPRFFSFFWSCLLFSGYAWKTGSHDFIDLGQAK